MSSPASGESTNVLDPAPVVQAIVDDIAQMDVDPEQNFFDLGLDSVQLMDICNRLVEELGDVIDLFRLFENPTVTSCAEAIREHSAT